MRTILSKTICSQCIGLVGAFILATLPMLYSYHQEQLAAKPLDSPTPNPPISAREAAPLVRAASRFPYIPQGEQPSVFLVNKPSALPAFAVARRGDAILIYQQANIAVLLDRQTENIINVIPLPGSGL